MKIEVGEYVRTDEGIIDKVIIEYTGKCNNPNCNEPHISCKYNYYNEKDIVNHSKDIIDLIEVGDIIELNYGVNSTKFEVTGRHNKYIEIENDEYIIIEDIKSILTHEQYERNTYRLEE